MVDPNEFECGSVQHTNADLCADPLSRYEHGSINKGCFKRALSRDMLSVCLLTLGTSPGA